MANEDACVATFPSHVEAETAIKALQQAGFEMKKLSIVGKDYHSEEHVVGYYNSGDRMKAWGKLGGFWGGLWGVLVGAAFFAVPGIGPIAVAFRLSGRDSLHRGYDPSAPTYWSTARPARDKESYFHQY